MSKNKLIIAAAGAGKTTFIIKEALRQSGNILITTYTEANEAEIRNKIIKLNRFIPPNITVQTWFSFLIQHGVKPYQGCLIHKNIGGLCVVNEQSGLHYRNNKGFPVYYSESDYFEKHYFSNDCRIYSDKLSKFVVRCNEKSTGNVIDRIYRIYSHIYVDEVQDLAGYDLEILKLLFQSSSQIILVGDPRQVTYVTHHEKLHSKYKDGNIEQFILDKCKSLNCTIDKSSLNVSHRNNIEICKFSSKLYPSFPETQACICENCQTTSIDHRGVFVVKLEKLDEYLKTYRPVILRFKGATELEWNFGKSKGLGFERVLIYPTQAFTNYLKDGQLTKIVKGKTKDSFDRSKFYVAITRAKHSVAIVHNYSENDTFIDGLVKY